MLTVLAADAASGMTEEDIAADDEALSKLLDLILARLIRSSKVKNPVASDENLNRLSKLDYDAFITNLQKFLEIARRANWAGTEYEAALVWQEAFGHLFPMPEQVVVMPRPTHGRD